MWPPTYICDLLDSLDVELCEGVSRSGGTLA